MDHYIVNEIDCQKFSIGPVVKLSKKRLTSGIAKVLDNLN
jgi:hypothetical protein